MQLETRHRLSCWQLLCLLCWAVGARAGESPELSARFDVNGLPVKVERVTGANLRPLVDDWLAQSPAQKHRTVRYRGWVIHSRLHNGKMETLQVPDRPGYPQELLRSSLELTSVPAPTQRLAFGVPGTCELTNSIRETKQRLAYRQLSFQCRSSAVQLLEQLRRIADATGWQVSHQHAAQLHLKKGLSRVAFTVLPTSAHRARALGSAGSTLVALQLDAGARP